MQPFKKYFKRPLKPGFNRSQCLFLLLFVLALLPLLSSAAAAAAGASAVNAAAVGTESAVTTSEEREQAHARSSAMQQNSPFKQLQWIGLGPYFTGGRVVDIEGYQSLPFRYLVASASGGLWLTENNGTTWEPIFDHESSITIGDIAVSQSNPDLIWVGTGEANFSPASFAGTGVFKSTDSGRSWQHMGLADTHHIGRILIDPADNNTVYVAALGHIYSPNTERGVFKTTDGGKTWKQILFIDTQTGVIDLVMHPRNAKILYAAAWQKERKPWDFTESGSNSAIYKTIDGGQSWQKKVNGFPQGPHVGRIGLAVSPGEPDVIYALLDNQDTRPLLRPGEASKGRASGIYLEDLVRMSTEEFLLLDNRKLNLFLKENRASEIFDATILKALIREYEITPQELAQVISEDKDKLHLMVYGAELFRSSDGAETWQRTHQEPLDSEIYLTYGFYFGQVRVSPFDAGTIYIMGVPVLKSTDGGRTFKNISEQEHIFTRDTVHVDSHAMWLDPTLKGRILLGNDGGFNISYDAGETWEKIGNLPLAQCYTVNYDNREPYYIYSGLQDNGVVFGPRNVTFGSRLFMWRMLLGADGASVEAQKDDPDIIYAASQFGTIFRFDLKANTKRYIKPGEKERKKAYRFNWLAPFMISRHDSSVIYMAANVMLKSTDRGDHWQVISQDLTGKQHIDGNVPYATITTIDESPFSAGILYAGTDDGNIWASRNGGQDWRNIASVLPVHWVTRVIASQYQEERLYVTMSGSREDDFKPYVYVSHDSGINWHDLGKNLPAESINVIREDPYNEYILYLGTDSGIYISLDAGDSWHSLRCNLPGVAVKDIQVQPRDRELIIATHGRGIFVLPVKTIEELTPKVLARPFFLAEIQPVHLGSKDPRLTRAVFEIYTAQQNTIQLIIEKEGKKLAKLEYDTVPGLNIFSWDLVTDAKKGTKAPAGDYRVTGSARTGKIKIERHLKILEH